MIGVGAAAELIPADPESSRFRKSKADFGNVGGQRQKGTFGDE